MAACKKFRSEQKHFHQDSQSEQVPIHIMKILKLISRNFPTVQMRSLDVMEDSSSITYGILSHYEGNNIFWIQPGKKLSNSCSLEYGGYLDRINSNTTSHCGIQQIEIGQDCIACYEKDRRWYRAITLSKVPNSGAWTVLFIDYGNQQITPISWIKKPYSKPGFDHFQAPVQAVCCRLCNLIPRLPSLQVQFDKEMKEFLSKNLNSLFELDVKSISIDGVVECGIFICDTDSSIGSQRLPGAHIGQFLVKAGIAKFVDKKAAHTPARPKLATCFDVEPTIKTEINQELKRKIKKEIKSEFPEAPKIIKTELI